MTIKVIQWATGAIGKTCLRSVIDHPDLELVGLYVHSDKKAGKDAGEIARRDPTGVIATQSEDEIVNTKADVVLYLPLNAGGTMEEHDRVIQRLLRSGKNVITTVAHIYPKALGENYWKAFDDAGKAGNATLFGTGVNPGVIAERIGVAATAICTKVDSMLVTEVYDCTEVRSPGFIFDLMGVGRPVEYFEKGGTPLHGVFEHIFREVVEYCCFALGEKIVRVEFDHEFVTTPKPIRLAAGDVPADGVVNFRWRFHGVREDGVRFFTIQMLWICDKSRPGWDLKDGWDIEISGAPGVKIRVDLKDPVGLRDRSKAMQYAVAGPVIRAIPEVMKAAPGVLTPPTFAAWSPRMNGKVS